MVLGEGKVESHQPTVERREELNINNNINFEIVYFSFAPRSSAFLIFFALALFSFVASLERFVQVRRSFHGTLGCTEAEMRIESCRVFRLSGC